MEIYKVREETGTCLFLNRIKWAMESNVINIV